MSFLHPLAPPSSQAIANLAVSLHDERKRYTTLTSREREIFDLVTEGCTTRQVAAFLRVHQKTAENIRARMMDKIGAGNVVELVRFASRHRLLGISAEIPW